MEGASDSSLRQREEKAAGREAWKKIKDKGVKAEEEGKTRNKCGDQNGGSRGPDLSADVETLWCFTAGHCRASLILSIDSTA